MKRKRASVPPLGVRDSYDDCIGGTAVLTDEDDSSGTSDLDSGDARRELKAAVQDAKKKQRFWACQLSLVALPSALLTDVARLRYLDVSHNFLSHIPAELFTKFGSSLEMLLASDNPHITSLPATIGRCRKLQTASFARCSLAALPASVGRLKKLAALRLQGNRLASLPRSVAFCEALRELDVEGQLDEPLLPNFAPLDAVQIRAFAFFFGVTLGPHWVAVLAKVR